jgi:peptide-methionine (R)-S-oxide reductase
MADKIEKSDEEWRVQLSPDSYVVARQHGTERPFSGEYNDCKTDGVYSCICCGNELFTSGTKFDSGTGWPSFYAPMGPGSVETTVDRTMFMSRTEVHCAKCDGHLGHVFPDGPMPSGQRYCMNSVSMKLTPVDDANE